jgi:hypothetical protein
LRDKVDAWRRGFRAESAAVYDLAPNDIRCSVSDDMRARCAALNPMPAFYSDKLMLRAFLLTRGFPQPETVAFIGDGNGLLNPLGQPYALPFGGPRGTSGRTSPSACWSPTAGSSSSSRRAG